MLTVNLFKGNNWKMIFFFPKDFNECLTNTDSLTFLKNVNCLIDQIFHN